MHLDHQSEIKYLHHKIIEKKIAFEQAMKNDIEFGELKKIYQEIKDLEKQLHQYFEQNGEINTDETMPRPNKLTGT